MRRYLGGCAVALTLLGIVPASAATISIGGKPAPDGSGRTTTMVGANVFVEDFDGAGGCALRPEIAAVGGSVSGSYALVSGSLSGRYAAPLGDGTCYLSAPHPGSNGSGSVSVDLGSVFTTFPNQKIDYLGLYWGSIDTYNAFTFYDGDTLLGTISGADVLQALNLSGNQTSPGSNRYVDIFFGENERFTRFEMISNGFAFEVDNLAVRVVQTPEPAALGLFGLGIGALGWRARRRR